MAPIFHQFISMLFVETLFLLSWNVEAVFSDDAKFFDDYWYSIESNDSFVLNASQTTICYQGQEFLTIEECHMCHPIFNDTANDYNISYLNTTNKEPVLTFQFLVVNNTESIYNVSDELPAEEFNGKKLNYAVSVDIQPNGQFWVCKPIKKKSNNTQAGDSERILNCSVWKFSTNEIEYQTESQSFWIDKYKLYVAEEETVKVAQDDSLIACQNELRLANRRELFTCLLIGWVLSVASMVIMAATSATIASKKFKRHKVIHGILCSLCATYICNMAHAIMFYEDMNSVDCIVVTAVSQYFTITALSWMNIHALDVYLRLNSVSLFKQSPLMTDSQRFIRYMFWALGFPLLLLVPTTVFQITSHFNGNEYNLRLELYCWFAFKDELNTLCVIYGPTAIMVVFNIVIFILSMVKQNNITSGVLFVNKIFRQKLFAMYLKFTILIGFCKFSELISWSFGDHALTWYIMDIVNSFQGIFILLLYLWSAQNFISIARICPCLRHSELSHEPSYHQEMTSLHHQDSLRRSTAIFL